MKDPAWLRAYDAMPRTKKAAIIIAAAAILFALDFVVIGPYSVTEWLYGVIVGALLIALAAAAIFSAIMFIIRWPR
ncbi:MAG: hypothetical protein N2690_02035 [Rhodocyclaceae bacterium]|nr:hypothetical protein [Rhodocyclaceae bacterium]